MTIHHSAHQGQNLRPTFEEQDSTLSFQLIQQNQQVLVSIMPISLPQILLITRIYKMLMLILRPRPSKILKRVET